MTIVKYTVYRTLEWKAEVEVEDPENEDEVRAAIESNIPRRSSDFDTQIEEYAELENGMRIEFL